MKASVTFLLTAVCLIVAIVGYAPPAGAVPISWNAAAGDWSDPNNWSPVQTPTSADQATIGNGGTAQVTAAAVANTVTLGAAGASGSLEIGAGSLTTSGTGADLRVGSGGSGAVGLLTQTGGAVSVGVNLNIGLTSSTGTYTLEDGTLGVGTGSGNILVVGNGGTGIFNQNGGAVSTPGYLHLGRTNGNGTYNMDDGTLTVAAQSYIAGMGGNSGVGEFNQTGGTVTFNSRLNVGGANSPAAADGTYNMGGGTLNVANNQDLVIGGLQPGGNTPHSGVGVFDHTAGDVNVAANLILGAGGLTAANNAVGSYLISGGVLRVNGTVSAIGNALGTSGTVTQTGGTMINANDLWLGRNNSTGTYNLQGGRLVTPNLTASGASSATFTWTGGTLATNVIGTGLTLVTNNGGTLSPGVSSNILDTNIVGTTTFNNQNSYDQTAAGTLAIDIASVSDHDRVVIGTGGPGTAQLAGTVAVTLLSGYDPAPGTAFDVLRADSISNLGITAAGLTPSGYGFSVSIVDMLDNEDFQVLRLTVDDSPTESADFDGDGDVDGADFLTWQRGVGVGSTHEDGDADHNGAVDGFDLDIWERDFGPAAEINASSVPEPAGVALIAIAATGLAMARAHDRRRRGRSR